MSTPFEDGLDVRILDIRECSEQYASAMAAMVEHDNTPQQYGDEAAQALHRLRDSQLQREVDEWGAAARTSSAALRYYVLGAIHMLGARS